MLHRRLSPLVLALGLALTLSGPSAPALAAGPPPGVPGDHCGASRTNGNGNPQAARCAPESPLPVGLPLAGLAVFGGYIWLVRRRDGRKAVPSGPHL
jgi:hypothetical protein